MRRFALSTTVALLACVLLAPPAVARLAVVANGKSKVKIVDLGRKQVVARPDAGAARRRIQTQLACNRN